MNPDSAQEIERKRRNSLVGLALMFTATAAFVAMTAFVKLLREDGMTTPEVMFWRMAPGLPWVWVELRVRGLSLWPKVPTVILVRCVWGITAMAANFYAVRVLTLVQSNVLHLLQPVFIALLSPFLLKERLRGSAIVALMLAVVGSILVIDPRGHQSVPVLAATAGVAGALFSGLAHLWVRRATEFEPPELVVFYFTATVTVLAGLWGLSTGALLELPSGLGTMQAAGKIAGMAGFGLAGQLLMTRAYDRTQAPLVAVVAYSSIPLSFALDVIAWGALGTIATLVGCVLMVIAGVLLVRGKR